MAKKKKDEGIPPKRGTNVILEHMESEIKKIAEGHSFLVTKSEKHDKEFEKIHMEINIVGAAVSENGRVTKQNSIDIKELKSTVEQLQTGQEEINQKLDKITINHEERIKKLKVIR